MSNDLTCNFPGCDGGTFPSLSAVRKHRYQYHGAPVPFVFDGKEYAIIHNDNKYTCPLPNCNKAFKRREDIRVHIFSGHGVDNSIKLFNGLLSTGEHDGHENEFILLTVPRLQPRELPMMPRQWY